MSRMSNKDKPSSNAFKMFKLIGYCKSFYCLVVAKSARNFMKDRQIFHFSEKDIMKNNETYYILLNM